MAGVAFLPRAWTRPWFMALVAVVAAVGLAVALTPRVGSWLSPATAMATIFVLPLAQAPLYALALSDASVATAAESAGRYLRLLGVNLLTAVFLSIPALLLSVVALGAAYGMAYASPGFDAKNASTWTAGGPVLLGDGLVFGAGGLTILWLMSRVSLGPAASVVERRVVMLSTWPLTRGLGWRIAAARLVMAAVALAVVWIVGRVLPSGASTQVAPIACDILFLAIGLPIEVGALSFFFARRSPLPVAP